MILAPGPARSSLLAPGLCTSAAPSTASRAMGDGGHYKAALPGKPHPVAGTLGSGGERSWENRTMQGSSAHCRPLLCTPGTLHPLTAGEGG